MRKNITILSLENIKLFSKNITSHFTGKEKIITLVLVIIILSFANIINTSALSYSSSVNVGFTFNPTLSVNISPSDLMIQNLTPGTTADSNNITVSVATNAAYGYTLSAIMNENNNDLTHTNRTNTFSSIATDSSLPNLVTDNTWGYSYKLSNDANWNNYSGLSTETSKTLVDSNDQTTIPIDFKIAAKASSTQPSGTYAGTINFTAVSNVAPMSLLDSFIASGAEQLNGYFKMQDMTHSICSNVDIEESELQLIDVRDNKVYWVAKLKDGNCWMTQNLDFDIQKDSQGNAVPLTSGLTDLVNGSLTGIYASGYTYTPDPDNPDTQGVYNGLITWSPNNSTNKAYTLTSLSDWQDSSTQPYSYDRGEIYPDEVATKEIAGNHALSGNYYNRSAAIASNSGDNSSMYNSICPRGWRLPNNNNNEFGNLFFSHQIIETNTSTAYLEGGFKKTISSPLYFVRSGWLYANWGSTAEETLNNSSGVKGYYHSSTFHYAYYFYGFQFNNSSISPKYETQYERAGQTIRCIAR